MNEIPPSPAWPDGIEVQTLVAGEGERLFYSTLEEAISDHWGHVPTSFVSWKNRRMRHGFDPGVWFLAVADSEPAGAAICSISENIGWVDSLGVRRPWCKRGVGLALLQHAVGEFRRRGLQRVALGVDAASPTGATRLYERAGLTVAQQHATYAKELRPGIALTEPEDAE
ncbi:MAG: GNAT family N-acetyltransferase [Chloroflexia bacterium]|nr:GNAT family N-acetyltransferase [Chloroflexia bacterium]